MPLVDPVTRAKVKFNPQVFKDGLFSEDQIMKEWWGGKQDFEYKHENYWEDLATLCETRSKTWEKNWRTLGAKVGESEWAYKQLSSSRSDTPLEKAEADITVSESLSMDSVPISKATEESTVPPEKKENVVQPSTVTQDASTTIPSSSPPAAGAATGAVTGNADADAEGNAVAE